MLVFALLICGASAEVVEPGEDFYYLDEANVLSDATEGEIFFANQRLYEACGAEIAVVAIPSTGNMAIDDYAYTLFNQWEIGGSSYRGMLLLMAIQDDDYYVMPGTAMSGYFDSATLGEMCDTYLEPSFASKNYDQGARRLFEAIYEKIADDLNLNLSISDAVADYNAFLLESTSGAGGQSQRAPEARSRESGGGVSVGWILLIVILLIAVISVSRNFRRRASRTYCPPPPPGPTVRTNRMSFPLGFMLGRMSARPNRPRTPPPGPGVPPPMGGFGRPTPPRNSRPNNSRLSGGSFGGGFSQRSSGAGRSTSGRPSGGFGGASRSGGASRGPSTRGGGTGRFSRR